MMDAATLSMLPPKLLAQYLRDPQSLIAQDFIEKGSDTSPIQSPWQGVARLAKGALGGYMAGKLRQEYGDKGRAVADERKNAMMLAMGRPAEREQTSEGYIDWNKQDPNYIAAASALASPDNQDMAGNMFTAKVNQDQLAAQQAFNQAQQERLFQQQSELQGSSFAQQKALAEMTAQRQKELQDMLLNRTMTMEQWKLNNDPIKLLLQQTLQPQVGGQSAPNMPTIPIAQQPTGQRQAAFEVPTGGIPQVNASQIQAPISTAQIPPPALPQGALNPQDAIFNAALASKGLKAPDGMMFNRQMQVVPVPNQKMTDEQAKALGFADRMKVANDILGNPDVAAAGLSATQHVKGAMPFGTGNLLVNDNYQKYDQASRDFVNALLRRESGAAISEPEFDNARKQYFPQPGDSEAVLQQKANNRALAMQNVLMAGGPAAQMHVAPQSPASNMKFLGFE